MKSNKMILRIVSAITITIFQVACYTSYRIPSAELRNLDGYSTVGLGDDEIPTRDGQDRAESYYHVTSTDGKPIIFTPKYELRLAAKNQDVSRRFRHYSQIRITDEEFLGFSIESSGDPIVTPLKDISYAEVRKENVGTFGRTVIGATIGICIGVVLLGFLVLHDISNTEWVSDH